MHPNRRIETFRIAGRNLVVIRVAEPLHYFNAGYRGRTVPRFRLAGRIALNDLGIGNARADATWVVALPGESELHCLRYVSVGVHLISSLADRDLHGTGFRGVINHCTS